MHMFRRGMIFLTFFGSCIAMALLVASLGTKQWVNAKAKRVKNPHESDGRIHFGLFDGKKELNVAYGWRTYEIDGKISNKKNIERTLHIFRIFSLKVISRYPYRYAEEKILFNFKAIIMP